MADFEDSSAGHTEVHTPTITDATIDTVTYKYGGGSGSILLNQEVTYPDSNDWYLPGDLTISAWVYISSTTNAFHMAQYKDSKNSMRVYFGRINAFFIIETLDIIRIRLTAAYSALSDGWHHFQIGIDKDVSGYIFIDGIKLSLTYNTYIGVGDIATTLSVGRGSTGWSNTNVDVLKIDKGICRHTSGFTPPADEDVDNDEYTVLLLKMNLLLIPFNINIGDAWKEGTPYINIGDEWKEVTSLKINIGGVWKDVPLV